MQDVDLQELYTASGKLLTAMQQDPVFADVNTDLDLTTPSINVKIDRDAAASLGITANQIETALGAAFGGLRVSPIYTQADQYWTILELLPKYQEEAGALNQLYLATRAHPEHYRQCRLLGAAVRRREDQPEHPAPDGKPFGSARGGDRFVQPAARRGAQ